MADQTQNVAESLTTDTVSTGAKILSDNDAPENLYADPDGVPNTVVHFRRRGAASGSFGGAVQNIVVRFRRRKHLFHMLRRGAASGSFGESPTTCTKYVAFTTNPATLPPHAKLLLRP